MALAVRAQSVYGLPPLLLDAVVAVLLGMDRTNHGPRRVMIVSLCFFRLMQLYAFHWRFFACYLQADVVDLRQKPSSHLLLGVKVRHKDAVLMELRGLFARLLVQSHHLREPRIWSSVVFGLSWMLDGVNLRISEVAAAPQVERRLDHHLELILRLVVFLFGVGVMLSKLGTDQLFSFIVHGWVYNN